MAFTGTMVRWFESHQIAPDIGHIPVSNLYEVFVLFCWLTTLFYLYYEQHYAHAGARRVRDAGGQRGGRLPALVHGRARGAGDPAAGAGAAELVDEAARAGQFHRLRQLLAVGDGRRSRTSSSAMPRRPSWVKLAPLFLLGVVLCIEPLVFRKNPIEAISSYWAVYFGVAALIVGAHPVRRAAASPNACRRSRCSTT